MVAFFHKHFDRSVAVRATEVADLTFTRAVMIHILILYIHRTVEYKPPYPVDHGQAHPHPKGGREVNPLREIGEQLVIKALHPEALQLGIIF